MKFNEYQEVYNSSRKQIESVRLGDVSYIITCRVMQTTRDIEAWEEKLVKLKLEHTVDVAEWCQGRIEGLMHQREALRECLRLIEKTTKM